MTISTVKISNVSLRASLQEIKEFFSFSGDIFYVEMQRGDESSQVAYVTFRDSQGADTALLLTGAKIVDVAIDITPDPTYKLPADVTVPEAASDVGETASGIGLVVEKAESVVTTMLAKGFVLGKDALNKAKSFDEKHQLTSTASAKVSDFDKKIGLREKISMGTAAVNGKVMEMDQKYQVSEKTKSAIAAAEQKVSTASSAIMNNRYVFSGAAWVTGALNKVRAASDAGSKTTEKTASEQESRASNDVGTMATEKTVTEQKNGAGTEIELKTIDKAVALMEPQKDGASTDIELKATDKAVTPMEPHEDGAGTDVELKAMDKAVTLMEPHNDGAGTDVELRAIDKTVTVMEPHKHGAGTDVELRAIDKTVTVMEPHKDGAGTDLELKPIDKAVTVVEPHKDEAELTKVDCEISKDTSASKEHDGKSDTAKD